MAETPAESLTGIDGAAPPVSDHLRLHSRRLTFVVLFRVILISLVLGATTLLHWLAESDLTTASSFMVYAVVGATYVLTLAYSLLIRAGLYLERLGVVQLIADLAIAAVIVHATGGAQSAYTFFFPVAIIGAALLVGRRETILISVAALGLFLLVSVAGWSGFLPAITGEGVRADSLTPLELLRSLALNSAAIVGVALLSVNLGSQLQQTRRSLASQTTAAADLRTLHSDIVRSLASGLITVDTRWRINSVNDAGRRILGDRSLDLVDRKLAAVFPSISSRAANNEEIHRVEERVHVDGREVTLGVSVSPLFDHNSNPIGKVVNFQDLTELREMEAQVKRAERLAVIGRLAAGVAHEIRNPLASISGSIELLRSGGPSLAVDDENATLMDIVTREIDRLNLLITELLDYTNPGAASREELDLAMLVRDTAAMFARDTDLGGVSLELSGTEKPVTIRGDSEKLRQVVWNLFRNAAEAAQLSGGGVRVHLSPSDVGLTLLVEDDGPGISSDDLERIFEPFFTTKDGGTGLGLAIVHSVVEDHGGSVSAVSAASRRGGTVFRVELPYNLES